MDDKTKLEAVRKIAEKYATATTYNNPIIVGEGVFEPMPFLVQKFVNQIGNEILEALGD